ncbi:hypothetical protein IQ255_27525 [Pleurocapsales cyanobacterium LEGE 10410]|nr:hypothetical protein [Pleurocapsales cyanobacterium LEGE 10410]
MAKHIWSVACQNAIVDKHSNLVSYINSFDQIGIPELPYVFPPLVVASLWQREKEDEKFEIKVAVISPNDEVKKEKALSELSFVSNFHRTHIRITPFDIEEAGEYKIQISIKTSKKWKLIKSLPIIINYDSTDK